MSTRNIKERWQTGMEPWCSSENSIWQRHRAVCAGTQLRKAVHWDLSGDRHHCRVTKDSALLFLQPELLFLLTLLWFLSSFQQKKIISLDQYLKYSVLSVYIFTHFKIFWYVFFWYFGIISNIQKTCKNSIKILHISFTLAPLFFSFFFPR